MNDLSRRVLGSDHAGAELRALLPDLFAAAPVGLALLDRAGCFVWINQTLAALSGRPAAEHLGRGLAELLPELAHTLDPALEQVLAAGEPVLDREVVAPRGGRIWQTSLFPLRVADALVGAGVVATDVTALKAAADAVAVFQHDGEERRRLFDRIMATTPDLVYLYDLQADRNVYANQALTAMLGYSAEQIQAMGTAFLPSVLHPDERGQRAETLARIAALPDGAVFTHTYRARHADGTWRWLQDRTLAFERLPDRRIRLVLGIVQDITERRELEAALRERSADLSTFLETMPIAVLVSEDARAERITGNSAAARLLRSAPGANLSLTAPVHELVVLHSVRRDGRVLAPEELPIQYAAAHGVAVHDPDLELLFSDGEVKHIAGYVSPLFNAEGAVRGAIAAYVDTTEHWRSQQMERLYARLSADLVEAASYADLLARVARLLVPDLADFCLLDLVGPDGRPVRAAAAHADPQRQAVLDTLLRYPPRQVPGGVADVLRGGAPLLISELPDELLLRLGQDESHFAALRALGPRSVMVVPLSARGVTLGTLTLSLTAPVRRYTPRDLHMAQEVGARVALALENAQLHHVTQQHAARMQALAEVSRRFAEAHPALPLVLKQVAEEMARRIGDCCIIRLLSADRQWLDPVALAHPDPQTRAMLQRMAAEDPYRVDEGLTGWVAQRGESVLIAVPDPATMRRLIKPEYAPFLDRYQITSVVLVPLRVRGEVIGTIMMLRNTSGHPYTRDDQLLLEDIADRAALAINHARLYDTEQQARARAEQQAERMARLQQITAALSGAITPNQVADIIVGQSVAALGALTGTVRQLSADGLFLEDTHVVGVAAEQIAAWQRVALSEVTPVSDAVRRGEDVWLGDQQVLLAAYPNLAQIVRENGYQAFAGLVLQVDGRPLGALGLSFASPQRFTPDDRVFIGAVAQQCAHALERARLYAAEQQARAAAERSAQRLMRLQTVTTMLSTALTIDQVAHVTIHQGLAALGARAGSVALLMPDSAALGIVAASGYSEPVVELWRRFALDLPTPINDAVRTGSPVWVESRAEYMARYPLLSGSESIYQDQAWAATPLVVGGRVLGALGLSFDSPTAFSPEDRAFAMSLVQQCALAFERAQLFEAEQRARAEAEAAVRVREQFLSIAAHELKTPLTPLQGQAQLLLRRMAVGAPIEERFLRSAGVIVNQAQRLSLLIAGLLDLNRLQSGRLELVRAPLDLVALVRRIGDELQPALDQHTLLVETPAEPLLINADALRLEQVLHNLLQNAVKYSPQGRQVGLRVARADGHALVEVRDQGIGIPQEALAMLFQPFYRATNAKDSSVMGMGIGLAVVKELVELHGGTVSVESTQGVGSTFTIRLPLL